MANRYGEAALIAARANSSYPVTTPLERWNAAVQQLYPNSPTQQRKGAPKGAFLGLCEEGLVKDIPAGKYTNLAADKAVAVRAVALLRDDAKQGTKRGVSALWREAEAAAQAELAAAAAQAAAEAAAPGEGHYEALKGADEEPPPPLPSREHNSQIDVVLALWNNHLITKETK